MSALFLTSCDLGARRLCCGYETREDWTSDISIVSGDGVVVFAYVSAIVEREDGYVVELREPDLNAPAYSHKDCTYARIEKPTGVRSAVQQDSLQVALDEQLLKGQAKIVLRTQDSCLTEAR